MRPSLGPVGSVNKNVGLLRRFLMFVNCLATGVNALNLVCRVVPSRLNCGSGTSRSVCIRTKEICCKPSESTNSPTGSRRRTRTAPRSNTRSLILSCPLGSSCILSG
ncbi:hypothetical protein BS47DRAFT_538149 [Hydnum rufescens UP504]|uniref:Uncharacterized protein n=1 Tax=Hydnum rufescens UP504 TaxID=1448309 RepID=A0A9P6AHI7_9AGAM|nr:hypothetical protein BS47DRAFT_538149 [Hydnum rufescens UP504]